MNRRFDRHSRVFAAVALALGTLPLAGIVQAADNPPTTPATITANRYSTSGADVIWARSTDDKGAVRGYEVTRDGVSLGIRDALSVSEKSLVAGRSYTYTVAAVDSAGQRSAPIRIVLGTKGFTNAAAAPGAGPARPPTTTPTSPFTPVTPTAPVPPVAGALAAPTGLRATAYSKTAGEVFWVRPSTAGLRYEVRRDGLLVKTTDGVSYYDNALVAGRNHVYGVVAIDGSGKRSPATTVTLTAQGSTPVAGAPTGPTAPTTPPANARQAITTANATQVLGAVFAAYSAKSFAEPLLRLPFPNTDAPSAYGPGLRLPADYYAFRQGPANFVCDNGGTLRAEYRGSQPSQIDVRFGDCQLGTTLVNGTITGLDGASRATLRDSVAQNLRIERANDTIVFNGKITERGAEFSPDTVTLNGDLDYPTADGGVLAIRQAATSFSCGQGDRFAFNSSLGGSLTLRSAATGNTALTASTTAPLEFVGLGIGDAGFQDQDYSPSTNGFAYTRGRLMVTAADGSQLLLNAANGDPSTYDVTVKSGGRTETIKVPGVELTRKTGCGVV